MAAMGQRGLVIAIGNYLFQYLAAELHLLRLNLRIHQRTPEGRLDHRDRRREYRRMDGLDSRRKAVA